MIDADFTFPIIRGLVARHAGDSAFYWSQLDRSVHSPQLMLERLAHFNRLLNAHLDGLRVAGDDGRQLAHAALEKWRKAGEAFVCLTLAAYSDDAAAVDEMLAQLVKRPDELVRGAISAIAWLPEELAVELIARWSASAEPVAQVVALRAAALVGASATDNLASGLDAYFGSDVAHVRAAACRAALVAHPSTGVIARLRACATDPALAARAESAIALLMLEREQGSNHVGLLLDCILDQIAVLNTTSGWYHKQASRRLMRWVSHLAWSTPPGVPEVARILAALPTRAALTFALCHADHACLPFVLDRMADQAVCRYAGWVWEMLTGVSLAAAGLTLPEADATESDEQAMMETREDIDHGLALPNLVGILDFMRVHPTIVRRGRVLLGQELSAPHAIDMLSQSPQVVRRIAAHALNRAQRRVRIDVRAPAPRQYAAMAALAELISSGETI